MTVRILLSALSLSFAMHASAQGDRYLSAHLGVTNVSDGDTPISAVGITVAGEADFDTGYDARVAAGYYFGNVRVEGELAYRAFDADSYTSSAVTGAGFGPIAAVGTVALRDTDANVFSAMANVWYDFDTGSQWRPYVGAGIGVARVELELGPTDTGSNSFKDDDVAFAYQLGVGLAYDLTPTSSVGVTYRHVGIRDSNFSDTVGGTRFSLDSELDSHSVMLGTQIRF